MRTFIAIPLPESSRRTIDAMQSHLRAQEADVRWTAVPSIHLTLKFLGELDPALLPALGKSLAQAAAGESPFELKFRGLGAFPNLSDPRVLWCGIEGDIDRLGALQRRVEDACAALGCAPEDRPFRPHLTLGRVRGRRNLPRLAECIRIGTQLECSFTVDHFNIFKSTLTPAGAVHTALERIELRR